MKDPVEREGVLRVDAESIAESWATEFLECNPGAVPSIDVAKNWFLSAINDALAAIPSHECGEEERLLAALAENCWDLRCFNIPTGSGDADVGWRVIGHWQAKPRERTVSEVCIDDPIAALRAALSPEQEKG